MTYPIRGYAGAASAGTLSLALSSSTTGSVASAASIASWNASSTTPLTSTTRITVAIDYGLATEEKVLAYYVDSTHINITARGVDGTTAQTHGAGAFFIPVWSATEAQEAQNAVQVLKPILTNTGGATNTTVIGVDATPAVGTAQIVAPIDHVHNLPSTSLATWLQTATLTASNLTLPVGNLSGTLTTAQLANASNSWSPTPVTSGTIASSATSVISQAAITGFATYLITFNATASMGGGANHNVVASIGINGTNNTATNMTQYLLANQNGCISTTYIYTTTIGASFSVGGFLYAVTGAGASVTNATLTIVGLA